MNELNTIGEAKQFLRDNWKKGVKCPCCDQRVQLYDLKLSVGQTRGLIELYKFDKENPNQYFNIRDIEQYRKGFGGGAFAKCKHWGLAVDKTNTDTGKRTSGMWAITAKGRQFVEGKILVWESVLLYNKKKWGESEKYVDIKTTLGKKFNYSELMGDYLPKPDNQQTLI